MTHTFPLWRPSRPPLYDITKSYEVNFSEGPFFTDPLPERIFPPEREWHSFLGFRIASPLGVPAGPLLNGRWVRLAAQLGFDLVTYKTIRSAPHPVHPLPNMVYVAAEAADLLSVPALSAASEPPEQLQQLAVTNSFGIPSRGRDYLVADIAQTVAALAPGQLLIVSVVGTPRPGEDFVADFVRAAEIALEGGAPLVEVDFSCPNVTSSEGELFLNPDLVFAITSKMTAALGAVPLIVKVGYTPEAAARVALLRAAARGGAQAICGINTIRKEVVDPSGQPFLGEKRRHAGICGGVIHAYAVDWVRSVSAINQREQLGLTIMGTGGVTAPEQFDDFLEAGATITMSAAGMLWDPYLAMRYHWKKHAIPT